jgi:hypothetical protein
MTDQILTDEQILAAFIARSEGSPSTDLADRIGGATRRTRQLPRLVVLPGGVTVKPERLLWAAAISATSLALVGGLLFAGRQPDDQTTVIPSQSPDPSTTPIAVVDPSATPPSAPSPTPPAAPESTPSAEPSATPLESPAFDPAFNVDSGAVTLTGDLRVRSKPGTGSNSAKLEPLLPAGEQLLVIEAPVTADGYAWYHVMPSTSSYPDGWVAAGSRQGEAWLGPDRTPCPTAPLDRAELASLGIHDGLRCFGNESIQVTGLITCTAADVDFTILGPSWLRTDVRCEFDGEEGILPYTFYADTAIGLPTLGLRSVVTGHFSDPGASACEWAVDPPAPDPEEVMASCRTMFVATDVSSAP